MRLHVFLAKAGIASRRAAEKIILAGRVKVNGLPVTTLGSQVVEKDEVAVDGRKVSIIERRVYLALHKPTGVLCTQHDERNRPIAIDLIPEDLRPGLFHAGRLDFMSSGLIFYTNDGDFAHLVTHPSSNVEKEYVLDSLDPIPPRMLEDYRKGVTLEGERYRLTGFVRESPTRVRIILHQGKNREIRTVCDAYGVKVSRLTRVRIGPVRLDGVSPGRFRYLKPEEIDWFRRPHEKPN